MNFDSPTLNAILSPSAGAGQDQQPAGSRGDSQLDAMFDRVNSMLGSSGGPGGQGAAGGAAATESAGDFVPREPDTLEETGLTSDEVERLIMKYLLQKGSAQGREICMQVCLPFRIVEPILRQLKQDQLVGYRGTANVGDFEISITDLGRDRGRRYIQECTYFGAAPVSLRDYLSAMAAQSVTTQTVGEEDLQRAFGDLILREEMLNRLGPAINSGRGMFLFGQPGNGKTSIAERVTKAFGSTIWIPKCLGIEGDIIRVYDPGVHEAVERPACEGLFDFSGIDSRWVRIVRPTVIAGGELTMDELEVVQHAQTKICEAPLQLKSNCGTLVIDDFGRQSMPVDVLLNRWIVPLEKRYDFLNLPSGKKIQVPFDQLIIFSTNLEPRDLVDDAFLRRIPYKIEVGDPDERTFRELIDFMTPKLGFQKDQQAIDYLVNTHYLQCERPFRACQPRDLLMQVRNYCIYKRQPLQMSPAAFDFAVDSYFAIM